MKKMILLVQEVDGPLADKVKQTSNTVDIGSGAEVGSEIKDRWRCYS